VIGLRACRAVVQSGDELVTMVPADAQLQVEASIPARGAGFVHPGNHAVIRSKTLPYTTYGFATGTLQTVSADSFASPRTGRERPTLSQPDPDGGAAFYRGTPLSVDEMKLHNLPEGFHMSPGMPVTTDIKVGKRDGPCLPGVPHRPHADRRHARALNQRRGTAGRRRASSVRCLAWPGAPGPGAAPAAQRKDGL
jgi:multidrug efflux pump subunit AcrA (membrane-fusion protein)